MTTSEAEVESKSSVPAAWVRRIARQFDAVHSVCLEFRGSNNAAWEELSHYWLPGLLNQDGEAIKRLENIDRESREIATRMHRIAQEDFRERKLERAYYRLVLMGAKENGEVFELDHITAGGLMTPDGAGNPQAPETQDVRKTYELEFMEFLMDCNRKLWASNLEMAKVIPGGLAEVGKIAQHYIEASRAIATLEREQRQDELDAEVKRERTKAAGAAFAELFRYLPQIIAYHQAQQNGTAPPDMPPPPPSPGTVTQMPKPEVSHEQANRARQAVHDYLHTEDGEAAREALGPELAQALIDVLKDEATPEEIGHRLLSLQDEMREASAKLAPIVMMKPIIVAHLQTLNSCCGMVS